MELSSILVVVICQFISSVTFLNSITKFKLFTNNSLSSQLLEIITNLCVSIPIYLLCTLFTSMFNFVNRVLQTNMSVRSFDLLLLNDWDINISLNNCTWKNPSKIFTKSPHILLIEVINVKLNLYRLLQSLLFENTIILESIEFQNVNIHVEKIYSINQVHINIYEALHAHNLEQMKNMEIKMQSCFTRSFVALLQQSMLSSIIINTETATAFLSETMLLHQSIVPSVATQNSAADTPMALSSSLPTPLLVYASTDHPRRHELNRPPAVHRRLLSTRKIENDSRSHANVVKSLRKIPTSPSLVRKCNNTLSGKSQSHHFRLDSKFLCIPTSLSPKQNISRKNAPPTLPGPLLQFQMHALLKLKILLQQVDTRIRVRQISVENVQVRAVSWCSDRCRDIHRGCCRGCCRGSASDVRRDIPIDSCTIAPSGDSRDAPNVINGDKPNGKCSVPPTDSCSEYPTGSSSNDAPSGSCVDTHNGSFRDTFSGCCRVPPSSICRNTSSGNCTVAPSGSCRDTSSDCYRDLSIGTTSGICNKTPNARCRDTPGRSCSGTRNDGSRIAPSGSCRYISSGCRFESPCDSCRHTISGSSRYAPGGSCRSTYTENSRNTHRDPFNVGVPRYSSHRTRLKGVAVLHADDSDKSKLFTSSEISTTRIFPDHSSTVRHTSNTPLKPSASTMASNFQTFTEICWKVLGSLGHAVIQRNPVASRGVIDALTISHTHDKFQYKHC